MSVSQDIAAESSWREMLLGKYASISAVLAFGISIAAIDINISATMLPSIVAEIGGQNLYAWNSTLFTLAAILCAAITGKTMRMVGVRPSFVLASIVFMAGSLIAAMAVNMPMMLLGRIIQGAGGGLLYTMCYSMIILAYGERYWPLAMALLSGTWGIMMLMGPAVGGIFAELDMWRLGFGIMLPVTAVFLILVFILVPDFKDREFADEPVAYGQLALLAGSVLAVSLGMMVPTAAFAILGVALSISMVVILLRRELSGNRRLFPTGAAQWNSRLFLTFGVMALLIFCVNAEFFMPFYLQKLHGQSPLIAGYLAALITIGWAITEIISARFTGRTMWKFIYSGPIIMITASILLGVATSWYEVTGPVLVTIIGLSLIVLGVGIGMGWPHINTFALKFTQEHERDMAASALSTVQLFAVAFGTAFAGVVGNLTGFNELDDIERISNSSSWLFITFGVVAVFALVASRKLVSLLAKEV